MELHFPSLTHSKDLSSPCWRALERPSYRCAQVEQKWFSAVQLSLALSGLSTCLASLNAAVTVGGKVKTMKCLGSNRAWLKQSPQPGQEANLVQHTGEDRVGALWTPSTQQPSCTTMPSVHNSQSTYEQDKRVISYLTIVTVHWSKALWVKCERINKSLCPVKPRWNPLITGNLQGFTKIILLISCRCRNIFRVKFYNLQQSIIKLKAIVFRVISYCQRIQKEIWGELE